MSAGAWVLVVTLLVAGAFGCWRATRDGRFRPSRSATPMGAPEGAPDGHRRYQGVSGMLASAGVAHEVGERATLVQFSSAFCAPCRATRQVLADVADLVPGVVHVEVDAEQHLELVRRLGILRTPTTVVLDGRGDEVSRASGAPRRDEVLGALAAVL